MSLHVLVIGGGIGGLCIAQGLREAGVSVAVYEKGERHPRSSWLRGYQIHINAAGSAALAECLPPATYHQFAARALQRREGVQQLDQINLLPSQAIGGSNPIVRTTLRWGPAHGPRRHCPLHKPFIALRARRRRRHSGDPRRRHLCAW